MAQISFLGDISFNGAYEVLHRQGVNPFSEVEPHLKKSDFIVGNLECLARGDQGFNELKKPRLHTHVDTLSYLNNLGINLVTLAHNHVYDQLESGFTTTTALLEQKRIDHIGASVTDRKGNSSIIKQVGDCRLGFLNYNSPNTNPHLPENATVFLSNFDLETALQDVNALKAEVDFVVILLHWGGNVEGSNYHDPQQQRVAHRLIDQGADLIVGGHSHTLQPFEFYKNKPIFYSLGNFCFADIMFENKLIIQDKKRRAHSIILNVTFEKNKSIHVDFLGIENDGLHIKKSGLSVKKLKRRSLISSKVFKYRLLWAINFKYFKTVYPFFLYFFRDGLNHKRTFYRQLSQLIKKRFLHA